MKNNTPETDEISIEMQVFNSNNPSSNDDAELLIQPLPLQLIQHRTLSREIKRHLRRYYGFYLGSFFTSLNVINYLILNYSLANYLAFTEQLEGSFVKGIHDGQQEYLQSPEQTCIIDYKTTIASHRFDSDSNRTHFLKLCNSTLSNTVSDSTFFALLFHAAYSILFIGFLHGFRLEAKNKELLYFIANFAGSALFTIILSPLLFNTPEKTGRFIGKYNLCENHTECTITQNVNFENFNAFDPLAQMSFSMLIFGVSLVLSSVTLLALRLFNTAFRSYSLDDSELNSPTEYLEKEEVHASILAQLDAYLAIKQSNEKFVENANQIIDAIEDGNTQMAQDFDQAYRCGISHEIMESPLKVIDEQKNIHYYNLFDFDRYVRSINETETIIDPSSKLAVSYISIDLTMESKIHSFVKGKVEKLSSSIADVSQSGILFFNSQNQNDKNENMQCHDKFTKSHRRHASA